MGIITRPDETETKMVVISGGTLMKFLRRLAWVATFIRENDKVGWRQQVTFSRRRIKLDLFVLRPCVSLAWLQFRRYRISLAWISSEHARIQLLFFFFRRSDRFLFLYHFLFSVVSFFNNNNNNEINFSRIFSVLSFINLLYRRSCLVGSVIITLYYTYIYTR